MHGPSNLTLIPIIQITELAYSWKVIKTHKILETNLGKNSRYTYKITCTRAVNRNKYQMNAMAMYYDLKVRHKNDLIFISWILMKNS